MSQMSSTTKSIKKVQSGDLFVHNSDVGLLVYNQNGISEFRMKQGYVFTVLEVPLAESKEWSHNKYIKVLMANTGKMHYVLERDFDAWLSRNQLEKLG